MVLNHFQRALIEQNFSLLEKHETDAGCGGLLATCVFFYTCIFTPKLVCLFKREAFKNTFKRNLKNLFDMVKSGFSNFDGFPQVCHKIFFTTICFEVINIFFQQDHCLSNIF